MSETKSGKKLRSGKAVIRAMLEFYKTHGWCQKHMAADENGNRVWCESDEAKQFCLVGAELMVGLNARYDVRNQAFDRITKIIGQHWSSWNDAPGRTKRQVMAMLRRALA